MLNDLSALVRSVLLAEGSDSVIPFNALKGIDVLPDVLQVRSSGKILVPKPDVADGTHPDQGRLSRGIVEKHKLGYKALKSRGMTDEDFKTVEELHGTKLDLFYKYDLLFNSFGTFNNVSPAMLKSIALRESTLKGGEGEDEYSSGRLMHFTTRLLTHMKSAYPEKFGSFTEADLDDPRKSLLMAIYRLKILADHGGSLTSILNKYGPGRPEYAGEVLAYHKFLLAAQVDPIGPPPSAEVK